MVWTSVCQLIDLQEGQGKYAEIEGFQLAIFLHHGELYAMDNRCPHAGANLSGGWIEDDCAVCPRHCWPFRLRTGELRDAPGAARVHVYAVRVVEGRVEVELPMP